jgi:hypothetical protein
MAKKGGNHFTEDQDCSGVYMDLASIDPRRFVFVINLINYTLMSPTCLLLRN